MSRHHFGIDGMARQAATLVSSDAVACRVVSEQGLIDSNLTTRRVRVAAREVVYVKSIFEASLGVGVIFAERGGDLTVATPHSRANALDELLGDLARELELQFERVNLCGASDMTTSFHPAGG